MSYPIDVVRPSGAIVLGRDVACDGFVRDAVARIQTHVHLDHMRGFESSKGCQEILSSEPTLELLVAEYNADLPYRTNVRSLHEYENCRVGSSSVTLVPSGHMLGSVQVIVEADDGERLGYSGDFQWPLDDPIQVEALVLDSTYGSPGNIREYSQGECEGRLVELVQQLISFGPVHLVAHRGTLQRGLQILGDAMACPVIGTDRLSRELDVYRRFGYTIPHIVIHPSEEATALLREGRCVRVYGTGDQGPVDLGLGSKVVLSAYFSRRESPVNEYSDRAYCVAMSNHADFEGTLEYVSATNASYVVTDNFRGGKGYELADALRRRLGIEARPSSSVEFKDWGGSSLR